MIHHFASGWPGGWERTPPHLRTPSRFSTNGRRITINDGMDRVKAALHRIGGTGHSIEWRHVGPLGERDPSAVVRWLDPDGEHVIAADHHIAVGDNLAAIAKSIEALHMLRRHGGQLIARRALSGFAALPAPNAEPPAWAQILGLDPRTTTPDEVERRYRTLAMDAHPDKATGSDAMMAALNVAREQARASLDR